MQYLTLILLCLILPYYGLKTWIVDLSIILFVLAAYQEKFNFKAIYKDKRLIILFSFILFTYMSILWSPAENILNAETSANIGRFKYYLLLLPGIYFAKLSKEQIHRLFLFLAIAPLGASVVYYGNALGITNIYSYNHGGDSSFFSHYLINNIFILFSASYFYIRFFTEISNRRYKDGVLYLLASIFMAISMLIDPRSTARLTIIIYMFIVLIVPLFYLNRKQALLTFLTLSMLGTLFILNNAKVQTGLTQFKTAIQEDKFSGSWGWRTGYAIVGLKIFSEHPIIGRGISDVRARTIVFADNNPKYFIGEYIRHFHNGHINTLVQVGVIGYALFFSFMLLMFKMKIDNKEVNVFKNITLITYLLLMMGEHYLSIRQTTILFALLIGLFILYYNLEKDVKIKQLSKLS